MALTHARLREIKLSNSVGDLKELIAHAEETLGPAPVLERIVDENGEPGELVELSPRELKLRLEAE